MTVASKKQDTQVWLITGSSRGLGRALGGYDDIRGAEGTDGTPLLDGALGHVTAVVADLIPSGDHAIVLCDVTSAHAENHGNPLLYCDRAYYSLHHAT